MIPATDGPRRPLSADTGMAGLADMADMADMADEADMTDAAQRAMDRGQGVCCEAPDLVRIPRAGWMRLAPALRLWGCIHCGRQLLGRTDPSGAALHAAVPLPVAPLRPEVQRLLVLLSEMPAGARAVPRR